jgi:hypothetical protein
MAFVLGWVKIAVDGGRMLSDLANASPTCFSEIKYTNSKLMAAVLANDTQSIVAVLDDEDPDYLNEKSVSNSCRTPLMLSIINNNTVAASAIIIKGADVNAFDLSRETAVIWATRYNLVTVVKHLISAGADIARKDSYGNTPLKIATKLKHDQIRKMLNEENMLESFVLKCQLDKGAILKGLRSVGVRKISNLDKLTKAHIEKNFDPVQQKDLISCLCTKTITKEFFSDYNITLDNSLACTIRSGVVPSIPSSVDISPTPHTQTSTSDVLIITFVLVVLTVLGGIFYRCITNRGENPKVSGKKAQ